MRFDVEVASTRGNDWVVVVPVKHLSRAKSRLNSVGVPRLDGLALAFFQDTAAAALACPAVDRVIVATSDPRVSSWATESGCSVFDDTGHAGINAAASGAAQLAPSAPLAVLVSDLPCATPDSMAVCLEMLAQHPRSFLSDAAGTGTTLWTRLPGQATDPRFGEESTVAHRRSGAIAIVDELGAVGILERMRRDVDTPADLADALRLGVGRHTARAVAGLDVP